MVEVVVLSSDDGMEADEERKKKKIDGGASSSSSEVVRWEKYLPKMVLRVLLVEADDSTRQIITAHLRKCSYRVAAVPDGLMAWETLKGKPQNIDLVLTELDLPSISGFALLTLVMEHEACKNIPVVMMSSQDSCSTVLKCMLRGAADYLIKPVRKNELRNLWQHVWRRHAVTSGAERANGSVGLGFSTKLMESAKSVKDSAMHLDRREEKLDRAGSGDEGDGFKDLGRLANNSVGFHSSREEKLESLNMTMDLIGAFDERSECLYGDSSFSAEDFRPELELSLKRFFPRRSEDRDETERQKLCRSNNSAFSRYDNGKPVAAAVSSSSEPKTSTETRERFGKVSSDLRSATTSSNHENIDSCVSGQFGQPEFSYQNRVHQSEIEPVSGSSQPVLITHQAKELKDSHFPTNASGVWQSEETMNCSRESDSLKHSQELEVCCQSTCTNSCDEDGIAGLSSSSAEKSKEEEQQVHVASQDGFTDTTNTQRSSQREAALTKFRMKRKDRCFEKKVRYQSRKKLAEQRPRVRGQFVRAVAYEIQASDVSNGA